MRQWIRASLLALLLLAISTAAGAGTGDWIEIGNQELTLPRSGDWRRLSPPTNTLRVVAVLDDTLIAVGENGAVARSTDKGEHWNTVVTQTTSMLSAFAALKDGTLIAVGGGGTVLRSTDKGEHWINVTTLTTNSLWDVAELKGDTLIAVGSGGTVLRSTDKGEHWINITSQTMNDLGRVVALRDDTLIAVGGGGTVLRSTDKGEHWNAVTRQTAYDLRWVAALKDDTLVAVGKDGAVVRSADRGAHWDAVYSPTKDDLVAVEALNDDTLIVVGEGGAVVRSTDRGLHWKAVTRQTAHDLRSLAALNNDTLIAVGNRGAVVRSTDRGEHWNAVTSQTKRDLVAVVAFKDDTLIAVGSGGTVLRSTDKGEHWNAVTRQTPDYLLAIAKLKDDTLIALGDRGTVVRSTDRGERWNTVYTQTTGDLRRVAALNDDTLIVVGEGGAVVRSTDKGAHWKTVTTQTASDLWDVAALDDNRTVIAVGENGAAVRSTDKGQHWNTVATQTTNTLWAVAALTDDALIAVGAGGAAVRSTDGGEHWNAFTSETTSDLLVVVALKDNTLIAVGDGGAVVRSTDRGEHWNAVASQTTSDLLAIVALMDDTLIAVGKFGAVVRSADGGEHWNVVTSHTGRDLWRVVALRGDTVMAVGDGGAVVRSTDRGKHWNPDEGPVNSALRDLTQLASGEVIAVGDSGFIGSTDRRIDQVAPAIEAYRFGSEGRKLSLEWRYGKSAPTNCATVFTRYGKKTSGNFQSLEERPARVTGATPTTYKLIWQPPPFITPNTEVFYSIECEADRFLPWEQHLPRPQIYMPVSIWDEFRSLGGTWKLVLCVSIALLAWLLGLLVLFAFAPSRLVQWHERMPEPATLDAAAGVIDKMTAGAAVIFRFAGMALLGWLGTSPRALDAWVARRATIAWQQLSGRPLFRDRRIAIDLPVIVDGVEHPSPWSKLAEQLRMKPTTLLIAGQGGAGKTTLACQIARRLIGTDGATPLGGAVAVPLFIDMDLPEEATTSGGITPYFAGLIANALRLTRPLSISLTKALLRTGTVVVILDGMTERGVRTQQAFAVGRKDMPVISRLVITSRDATLPFPATCVVMELQTIPRGALYDFIERYIRDYVQGRDLESAVGPTTTSPPIRMPSSDRIHDACGDLERLLGNGPVTPLLAVIWAKDVLDREAAGAAKPTTVAELLDRYVRRMLLPTSDGNEGIFDRLQADAIAVARLELGTSFRPGYSNRGDVLAALRGVDPTDPSNRMLLLLRSRLLEAVSTDSPYVRIAPDPVAEHLAARGYVQQFGGDDSAWRIFLAQLKKAQNPAGFVTALLACVHERTYGTRVSDLMRQRFAGIAAAPPKDRDAA